MTTIPNRSQLSGSAEGATGSKIANDFLDESQRAAIGARHHEYQTVSGWSYCSACKQTPWPCDAARLLDDRDALIVRGGRWRAELRAVVKERAALVAERDRLLELVGLLEWVGHDPANGPFCPDCSLLRSYGKHAVNCRVADALAACVTPEPPGEAGEQG